MDLNRTETIKDRTANFNKEETTKIFYLLRDYPILTTKKTDHASNQQKEAAWRSLAGKFNSDAVRYRSVKQLQQKFNNMKKIARKEMSEEKRGRRQTGGGPPPLKPSETTEWLNRIMGESISGLPAVHDSDALDDGDTTVTVDEQETNIVFEFLGEPKLLKGNTLEPSLDDATPTEMQDTDALSNLEAEPDLIENNRPFDASTPKALLRKPISKQLLSCYGKKKRSFTPLETRKHIITHLDKKVELLNKKKAREDKIEEYAGQEHNQNLKEKREMHLISISQMEEKHNLYMEQQKELHRLDINFKKKLHELLLEKSFLEIKELNK